MTYSYDLKIRMVNYYNNSDESLRSISQKFDISKSSLQRWVNNICLEEAEKKVDCQDRIKILNFLKRSLDLIIYCLQNLEMLKNKISIKFNTILTKKTISNYLKIINYSKKKITKRFYNNLLKDHLLNRKNMKKKLKKINKNDIVCIDESGINRKLYANYGWCKKNKRLISNISIKEPLSNYSLIMAITIKGVIKHELYKQQAINTDIYYKYLEDLLKNLKNKYILMDNISFHKSGRILELIKNSGNEVLFISPYSPEFKIYRRSIFKIESIYKKIFNSINIK
jgi:transposase